MKYAGDCQGMSTHKANAVGALRSAQGPALASAALVSQQDDQLDLEALWFNVTPPRAP